MNLTCFAIGLRLELVATNANDKDRQVASGFGGRVVSCKMNAIMKPILIIACLLGFGIAYGPYLAECQSELI